MTKSSDHPKPGDRRSRLPRSGLAEDILGSEEIRATTEATASPQLELPDESPRAQGPDRIFEFVDSLDAQGRSAANAPAERFETWVSFELAGEVFGLPVSHVQEILKVTAITPVPHAPHPVRGVTNKRGLVLPVVDLRLRLALPEVSLEATSRILVVDSRGRQLGLLVDAVHQVMRIAPSQIQAPPQDVMSEQSDYIIGVIHHADTLVILLDVDRVLVVKEGARYETARERKQ